MILVDVGNTNIEFVLDKGRSIKKRFFLKTRSATPERLKKILAKYPSEKILICSVVPKITTAFKKYHKKTIIVGKDVTVPIKCAYNKKQIGMDRLVAAYASLKKFSGTRIVIDFGTAVTVDFLSADMGYEGGIILPGIGSTLRVLSSCAMLPKDISLKTTKRRIPRDTKDSIAQGIILGFSAMLNTLTAQYKRNLNLGQGPVVITGGDARAIMSRLDFRFIYVPDLVIFGLQELAKKI